MAFEDNIIHLAFLIFSIAMVICSIKVSLVYKRNRNFASILMIISFLFGFALAWFAILQELNPALFREFFLGTLLFYNAALLTIFFYIVDFREVIAIPFTITIFITTQFFLSVEVYAMSRSVLNSLLGVITIIGFLYIGLKNRDGKSLGFSIHLLVLTIAGVLTPITAVLAGIFYFLGAGIILLAIFGMFDKMLVYEKQGVTWIEKELTTRG